MRTAAERRKLLARGASPWNRRLDCEQPCKGETERLPPFQGWRFILPRSRGGHRFEENWSPWLFSFAPAGAEQFTLKERCSTRQRDGAITQIVRLDGVTTLRAS